MKKLLIILVLSSLLSCKKQGIEPTSTLSLPALNGTTWYAYSYTGDFTGTKYYDYLSFINSTKVEMYTSDILGAKSGVVTVINTYTVTGNTFTITFANGQTASGKATDNMNVINYQGTLYSKR